MSETKKGVRRALRYIIGIMDPYGLPHASQVKKISKELAVKAGIATDAFLVDLEIGAEFHDIGKLGIPEYIRRNSGKYTPVERMMMQQHATIGKSFLEMLAGDYVTEGACKIVGSHHEDWNGSGYPDGLKGEEIPLGSRVIRIADFYDAITHERGYRAILPPAEALRYMEDQQVTSQWADPNLLRYFLSMIRDRLKDDRRP